MKYVSTRGAAPQVSFSEALKWGLAPDGGLYVPQVFPTLDQKNFSSELSLSQFGARMLAPFFAGDVLSSELESICAGALNFPIPLRALKDNTAVLELFHGPTAAFKDVGARFLAECVSREKRKPGAPPRTVIVATSGDTGGAVAGAFHGKPGIEVLVLFPKGKISARQEKQIAAWGGNVHALAVRGTFDDCQRVVKEALSDSELRKDREFLSANSISIGRLLPQMIYYAKASVDYLAQHQIKPGFIVPTGNLGNAVAALWAKRLGFPIRQVALATNANRSISDYFANQTWRPNQTVATLANAMDVGNPSNMERLRHLYAKPESLEQVDFARLRTDVTTLSVSDAQISEAIQRGKISWGEVFCPHTATAAVVRERLTDHHWILVATAHPAKFETIVEPLIGAMIEVPAALAQLLGRESKMVEIDPTLESFKSSLRDFS